MSRKPYPSDLTDAQWEELAPLLPPDTRRGHPRTTDLREVVNGILYVLRGGIPWRLMPHDLPPWGTVWWYFRLVVLPPGGTSAWWYFRLVVLPSGEMTAPGNGWRKPCGPGFGKLRDGRLRPARPSLTVSIIDSQSVKTTEKGGRGVTTRANG